MAEMGPVLRDQGCGRRGARPARGQGADGPVPQWQEQLRAGADRRRSGTEMLDIYTSQCYTLGLIQEVRQPLALRAKLRNVPEVGDLQLGAASPVRASTVRTRSSTPSEPALGQLLEPEAALEGARRQGQLADHASGQSRRMPGGEIMAGKSERVAAAVQQAAPRRPARCSRAKPSRRDRGRAGRCRAGGPARRAQLRQHRVEQQVDVAARHRDVAGIDQQDVARREFGGDGSRPRPQTAGGAASPAAGGDRRAAAGRCR